jgi:hypothetical protein
MHALGGVCETYAAMVTSIRNINPSTVGAFGV